MIFGASTGAQHQQARHSGKIIHDGGYTIEGSASYHALTNDGGSIHVQGQTISVTNNVGFTGFALAARLSRQNWGSCTINLNGHAVTGKRYEADDLPVISTFGGGASFLPGDGGGSTRVAGSTPSRQ